MIHSPIPQFRPFLALATFVVLGLAAEAAGPKTFADPEEALAALAAAVKADDRAQLAALFGPDLDAITNPDPAQGARELADFAALLATEAVVAKQGDDRATVLVGSASWPFPVPLARRDGEWVFDTAAGREEISNRRIGHSELAAIGVCEAYVEAQRRYASVDRDGDQVLEFASKLASSPGARDGLYWAPAEGEELSPFGPLAAYAQAAGFKGSTPEKPEPFHGYFLKILHGQGKHAPGGRHDYVINGNMIAGFALVAWPAEYGETGVMTFIVNQQGKVFQRDLGPKTAAVVAKMEVYEPDAQWAAVGSETPSESSQ